MLGLVQQGWQYLSDDALLLRRTGPQVEALTLRQACYLDAEASLDWVTVPGAEVRNTAGRRRWRVEIERAYPTQSVARCLPQVLLFPEIVPQPHSTLQPLAPVEAVRRLLGQSGLQVFDRATMGQHLQGLVDLVQQTVSFALRAGRDLHQQPGRLASLLQEALGADCWPA